MNRIDAMKMEIELLREVNESLTKQNERLRKKLFGVLRSIRQHPAGGGVE